MTAFFEYPKAAAFGRVVPKNKIYEHAGASTALKDLFITQVDQIVWKFKLASETVNLAATAKVAEIQVFGVSLRTGALNEDILRAIDRAIPFPLLFELSWSGKRKAIAAFKRPSEADPTKWVVSEYFGTGWVPEDLPRLPLPVALNLGALYEQILTQIMLPQGNSAELSANISGFEEASQPAFMHESAAPPEPIAARVARMEAIRAKIREIDRIKGRLDREKQFNKRVAINAELRAARKELLDLQNKKLAGARQTSIA